MDKNHSEKFEKVVDKCEMYLLDHTGAQKVMSVNDLTIEYVDFCNPNDFNADADAMKVGIKLWDWLLAPLSWTKFNK